VAFDAHHWAEKHQDAQLNLANESLLNCFFDFRSGVSVCSGRELFNSRNADLV
jgi:hypothetical protein